MTIVGGTRKTRDILVKMICEEYDMIDVHEGEIDEAALKSQRVKISFPDRRLGIKFKEARIDLLNSDAAAVGVQKGDIFVSIAGEKVQRDGTKPLKGIQLDQRIMEMVVSRPDRPLVVEFLRKCSTSDASEEEERRRSAAVLRRLESLNAGSPKRRTSLLLRSFPLSKAQSDVLKKANVEVDCIVYLCGSEDEEKNDEVLRWVRESNAATLHRLDANMRPMDIFAEIAALLNIAQPQKTTSAARPAAAAATTTDESEEATPTKSNDVADDDTSDVMHSSKGQTDLRQVALMKNEDGEITVMRWTCSVSVKAGARFVLPIPMPLVPATIAWEFDTDEGDIEFGIQQRVGGAFEQIVASKRMDSHVDSASGSVALRAAGDVKLVWDNTFSWINGKQLRYKVTVDTTAHFKRLKVVRRLQSKVKVVTAMIELKRRKKERLDKAAASIQSQIRGAFGRKAAQDWRALIEREESATLQLQRVARGAAARRFCAAMRARNKIALFAQKRVRGAAGRKEYTEMSRDRDLVKARNGLDVSRLHLEALNRLCDRHQRSFTLSRQSAASKAQEMQRRVEEENANDSKSARVSMLRSQIAEWKLEGQLLDDSLATLADFQKRWSGEFRSNIAEFENAINRLEAIEVPPSE